MNQQNNSKKKQPAKKSARKEVQANDKTADVLKKIGETFRMRRIAMDNMSLQELQKRSGVSYITIGQIEKGHASNAIIGKLIAVAFALELDFEVSVQFSGKK